MTDHYELLDINDDASTDQIRKAFHKAARKWHPDSFGTNPPEDAEMQMSKLNEAWSVLGDPESRKLYDRSRITTRRQNVKIAAEYLDSDRLYRHEAINRDRVEKQNSKIVKYIFILGLCIIFGVVLISSMNSSDNQPVEKIAVDIGQGIELGDCVDILSGPALLKVPCGVNADGVIVGAHLGSDLTDCSEETVQPIALTNGSTACLG